MRRQRKIIAALFRAFEATDASLVEINPFLLTEDGKLYALDAKLNLDDNALYRHKDLVQLRDFYEEDALEIQASRYGINYIRLDGTIGCMVNGAGLAMATMDIIKLAGGNPANFLDVGGGASAEQVRNAFQILLADQNVRAVLINIFGGIMRCDIVRPGCRRSRQGRWGSRSLSWSGWRERTSSRGRRSCAAPVCSSRSRTA